VIELAVRTTASRELVDVTDQVVRAVAELGLQDGAALVSSPHTTAGVIVNEGYDPEVVGDLIRRLERLAPREGQGDRHDEGNSDAHLVVALVGSSVLLPIADGGVKLGRWQRVFLVEWDGPRSRRLHVSRT
jgi:secondary thiamine-phosphate synthase enzyme